MCKKIIVLTLSTLFLLLAPIQAGVLDTPANFNSDLKIYTDNMEPVYPKGSIEEAFSLYLDNNPNVAESFLDPLSPAYIESYQKFVVSQEAELMNETNKLEATNSAIELASNGEILREELYLTKTENTNDTLSSYTPSARLIPIQNNKYYIRLSFIAASKIMMSTDRLYITGALLGHACNDNPSNQYFGPGTAVVNKIIASPDFRAEYVKFKKSGKPYTSSGMLFSRPIDLKLSFRYIDYAFRASNHNCSFTDIYNFDNVASNPRDIMNDPIIELVNLYGNRAVAIGAIQPYTSHILFQYSGD